MLYVVIVAIVCLVSLEVRDMLADRRGRSARAAARRAVASARLPVRSFDLLAAKVDEDDARRRS